MIDDPWTTENLDVARVEALRRLSVLESGSPRALDDLVAMLAQALGADAASVVAIEHERAWTLASTAEGAGADVPRTRTLSDLVIRGGEGFAVRTSNNDHARTDRPALGGLSRPSTIAAQAVAAPKGELVGGVEVVWEGDRQLGGSDRAVLRWAADLVADLLELHAEVSEYSRFIELSPDPVAILDLEGAIEQVNPAFVEMLGADAGEALIGRSFLEFVARADRARVTAELARVLFMQRRSGRLRLSMVGPTGRCMPCSVSAGHLRGVRRHLQLVLHDLSGQRRAEEEHSQLSEQLARAQRLDAVGHIAGGLAHDLNNLLVVMVSNLGLVRESLTAAQNSGDPEDLESTGEDLRELELAIDRASGLTNKLLQFARREEGASERADVVEVVEAVRGLVDRSLGPRVTLEVSCPPELPSLSVDPIQLERVLVNLVINARDAIEDDGTIRMEVALRQTSDPATDHGLGGAPAGYGRPVGPRRSLWIEVADDGRGMDEATRTRAFEPLFTTRSDSGGSGLGLATVLAFVDQSDGQVTLDSTVGRGTTVTLLLPVEDDEAALPVGLDVPVAGARVVLVDPGERTRRIISAMLTGAGYRVTAVASGEAALTALQREGAELLVTDLALPGIPGTRLIEVVARDHPKVRCVALASVDQPGMQDTTPVLVKPFSHIRLLRTVERVAESR